MSPEEITDAQRLLGPAPANFIDRTRRDYRRSARWLELEALRGYASADNSRRYAQNMRHAAELAGLYGPGTWLELKERAGEAEEVRDVRAATVAALDAHKAYRKALRSGDEGRIEYARGLRTRAVERLWAARDGAMRMAR